MGVQFWFFYDIIVVIFAIVGIYAGYKRGTLSSLILIIGFILSLLVSLGISIPISNSMYNSYFKNKNNEILENIFSTNDLEKRLSDELEDEGIVLEAIPDYDNGKLTYDKMYDSLNQIGLTESENDFEESIVESVSDTIGEMLENTSLPYSRDISKMILRNDKEFTMRIVNYFAQDKAEKSVEAISKKYLKSIEIKVIRTVTTFILTLAFMVFVAMISNRVRSEQSEYRSKADIFGGCVLGFIFSSFSMFVFCVIVQLLVTIGKEQMIFFNSEVIDHTYIFKYLYSILLHI